jgi:hypothetical protein
MEVAMFYFRSPQTASEKRQYEQTVYNFLPMLRGELYGPLRELAFFNQVCLDIEAGAQAWPNEADFDPARLHDWDEVGEAMITMARSWSEPLFNNTEQTAEAVAQ